MLDQMLKVLQEACQLDHSKRIVVGVSGGADSVCLFDLLAKAGYPLLAVYYNHNLRPEAESESSAVAYLAKSRQVEFVGGSGDVRGYADQHGVSIEMAARTMRYQFLFTQAEASHAQAVAVAHHADDQVETVLLHFLRGSGLKGLSGMNFVQRPNPWSAHIPLVRPLLNTWRSEILAYCRSQSLTVMEDGTNIDVTYTRNRIRHELIPTLESYNSRFKESLLRMRRVIEGEDQQMESQVDLAWQNTVINDVQGGFAFDIYSLSHQPVAIQRRILRRAAGSLRGAFQDLDFGMIENGIQAIHSPPRTRHLDLGLGLHMLWEESQVWVAAWEADLPVGDCPQLAPHQASGIALPIPGSLQLNGSWLLEVSESSIEQGSLAASQNADPYQAWVDSQEIEFPLVVRARKPGDRFHPLGMEGRTQKLSDLMINTRLPKRARSLWPLVCGGAKILWIPGRALSHTARLRDSSQKVLHLRLRKN